MDPVLTGCIVVGLTIIGVTYASAEIKKRGVRTFIDKAYKIGTTDIKTGEIGVLFSNLYNNGFTYGARNTAMIGAVCAPFIWPVIFIYLLVPSATFAIIILTLCSPFIGAIIGVSIYAVINTVRCGIYHSLGEYNAICNGIKWYSLGKSLGANEKATVEGKHYSQKQCFIKSVECVDTYSIGWCNLAITLKPDEKVTVNGKEYTNKQCFIRSVECDPSYSYGWNSLGVTLKPDETVTVNYLEYTKKQCYVRSLECDNSYPVGWCNLAKTLGPDETVTINGKEYTERQCFIRSVECDSYYSKGWSNLAKTLGTDEKVIVSGMEYTQKHCLVKSKARRIV